jgi:hypothetical protein
MMKSEELIFTTHCVLLRKSCSLTFFLSLCISLQFDFLNRVAILETMHEISAVLRNHKIRNFNLDNLHSISLIDL